MATRPRLILASTSPYRRALLDRLQLEFEVRATAVDESAEPAEPPAQLALRLAAAKARSVTAAGALIIGADQVAALDGRALGKPGNRDNALAQLAAAQERAVEFHTAAVLLDRRDGGERSHVDHTTVHFARLSAAALERYVDLERPYDCAGSFKAEALGIALFTRIESSDPTALIGLPLIWLAHALRAAGLDPLGER